MVINAVDYAMCVWFLLLLLLLLLFLPKAFIHDIRRKKHRKTRFWSKFHCHLWRYTFSSQPDTAGLCIRKKEKKRSEVASAGRNTISVPPWSAPRSGELRTQKLKSLLMRTQSLKVLPLKPGVGQYIAMHATLTARDFFIAYFFPFGPFTCIFFQNPSQFLLCWLWLAHGSCVGLQNKIGHPAGCRFPCWVPTEYE